MWAIEDYVSERRGETRPKAKTRIVHVTYYKQICVFVMHIIIYHMSMVYMFTKQTHVISMFSFHSVLLLALKHIIQECFVSHTIHMYIDTLQNIRILCGTCTWANRLYTYKSMQWTEQTFPTARISSTSFSVLCFRPITQLTKIVF